MSRYRHVSAMKAEGFAVQAACEAAEVSTSAYYGWLERSQAPTASEWDEAIVVDEMYDIHHHHDDTYGSPRMTDELKRRGYDVNHKRVERLQAENGIYAKDGRRTKVRTTIPDVTAPPLPDLVQRDFAPGEPAKRTCGDITYIPTGEGWLYMADVLDIGSRRIIGYALCDHMRSELVEQALDMAVTTRGGDVAGIVFHHDRGAQPRHRHGSRLPGPVPQAQGLPVRRPHRLESGQRRRRELLGQPQAGARLPLPFRHPGRGSTGDHRLGQPLQRRASALDARQCPAARVGTTLRTPRPAGRITMCPADGGKASRPCSPALPTLFQALLTDPWVDLAS